MEEEIATIVIDTGSGFCKSGFAGDDIPRSVIPSVIGHPTSGSVDPSAPVRPFQRGTVTNWDEMEKLWNHIFYDELRVAPEEHPVLLTEAIGNPKPSREKMTQIMFETFNLPAMYVASQPVLSLYAAGLTTGVAIESGDGLTQIVPVNEGYSTPNTFSRIDDLAGTDITNYLADTLGCEDQVATGIKQKCCRVALDFDSELNAGEEQSFDLPDGQQVILGSERFSAPEALFQPERILDIAQPGIHQVVNDAIQQYDSHLQEKLYGNIVPAGGSTLFPGFIDRMELEISGLAPSAKTNVITPKDQQYSAWVGGSVLASLSTFQNLWASRQDYDENGPSIVHKKCF
ncbi:actin family [Aspergillus minisclerotigenes]|uniref:Actin family n=1 Tax=Aspergillus minisclerotigenes TaxID=656917 RepID=A0A5N6IZQ8_9EURO|nr:actin family [Aspergillus minisclerotigenes]